MVQGTPHELAEGARWLSYLPHQQIMVEVKKDFVPEHHDGALLHFSDALVAELHNVWERLLRDPNVVGIEIVLLEISKPGGVSTILMTYHSSMLWP